MQIATLAMVEYAHGTDVSSLCRLGIFVPVSLLAASLGFGLFRYLTHNQFRATILNVLIASGLVLVLKSW